MLIHGWDLPRVKRMVAYHWNKNAWRFYSWRYDLVTAWMFAWRLAVLVIFVILMFAALFSPYGACK